MNKEDYISIPSSFLGFLSGLIDGDGYIQITKTGKGFITIKLTISLHLDDISTLEYINSVLKLGKITIYKDLKSPTCRLVINRTELQEILFPLFIHNKIFFLTETRINQFNLAVYILKNNIKKFEEIPSKIDNVFKLPENPFDYTLLSFFKNWIVGFACSNLYPGVVEFSQQNPLTYKRVKKDFKKLCSNRDSYYYLKKILKNKQTPIKKIFDIIP